MQLLAITLYSVFAPSSQTNQSLRKGGSFWSVPGDSKEEWGECNMSRGKANLRGCLSWPPQWGVIPSSQTFGWDPCRRSHVESPQNCPPEGQKCQVFLHQVCPVLVKNPGRGVNSLPLSGPQMVLAGFLPLPPPCQRSPTAKCERSSLRYTWAEQLPQQ